VQISLDESQTGRAQLMTELAQRGAHMLGETSSDGVTSVLVFAAPLAQLDGLATCVRTLSAG
jgi:hypothetical protein